MRISNTLIIKLLQQNFKNKKYSLTSPYGHLSITDSSFGQKCQNSYIPYLYHTDTSVKRTIGSVPLVSVLKRFDCT